MDKLKEVLAYEEQFGAAPEFILNTLTRAESRVYQDIKNGKKVWLSAAAFKEEFAALGCIRVMRNGRFGVYNLFSMETFKNSVFTKLFGGCILAGRKTMRVAEILNAESEENFPIYIVDDNASLWVDLD
jgi:hypothetical protein